MDMTMTGGPSDLGWTDVEACTLPTTKKPLRLAEFDDLFTNHLQTIENPAQTEARLLLAGGSGLAEQTQRLADAESSCCSFFTFTVSTLEGGNVVLDIEVPQVYTQVLASLVARAESARDAAS